MLYLPKAKLWINVHNILLVEEKPPYMSRPEAKRSYLIRFVNGVSQPVIEDADMEELERALATRHERALPDGPDNVEWIYK